MPRIREAVGEIVHRYAARESSFDPTRPLRELGIDGVMLARIVNALEARFGLTVPPVEALCWVTGDDVVMFIGARSPSKGRDAQGQGGRE
jgi:acyl carrier protein